MLIWAADLDDLNGTSINALADALGKPRSTVDDLDGLDLAPHSDLGDSTSSQASKSRKRRTLPPGRYVGGRG
jgi:hypothetical protein